jgi:hypothetical protein
VAAPKAYVNAAVAHIGSALLVSVYRASIEAQRMAGTRQR